MSKHLPIPQFEFGFAAESFNLFQETTLDGERIARERTEAERARRQADAAQRRMFPEKPTRRRSR